MKGIFSCVNSCECENDRKKILRFVEKNLIENLNYFVNNFHSGNKKFANQLANILWRICMFYWD